MGAGSQEPSRSERKNYAAFVSEVAIVFSTQEIPLRPHAPGSASMQPRLLQRTCACGGSGSSGGECEECKKKELQRRAIGNASSGFAPPLVHQVLRSPGQPLDAATRAFFEPRFGHDFSKVRLHTDGQAAESARAVNALAYTVGQDIAFGEGQYAPAAAEGRRLLAHELTHVVQQGSGTPASSSLEIGAPGSAAERDADQAAQSLGEGNTYSPKTAAGPTLARQSPPPPAPNAAPVIAALEDWGPETRRSCDTIFRWRVRWSTTGRDGYIVQEINRASHMFACTKGKARSGREVTLGADPPGHFWEAWHVAADGSMTPSNEDTWILTALSGTEGDWNISGKAYWVPTLDPKAGFAIQKWDPGQLATLKQPQGLGTPQVTRVKQGTWNCCEDKATDPTQQSPKQQEPKQ